MKMLFPALIVAVAILIPARSRAAKPMTASMVPTADAALDAMSAVITDSKARQTQLTTHAEELQKQIAVIKAKAKNSKVDIAEQLSKEDLDAYNLLNTQLRYIQNEEIVEIVRQKDLSLAKDVYQASFFVATMMTEYIGAKGAIDDDFDDFCQAKAKAYGLATPVGLLLDAQEYIIDNDGKK